MSRFPRAFAHLVFVTLLPVAAGAQRPVATQPVTLLSVQKLEAPSARAVIVRRADTAGDAILVDDPTTPEDLARAFAILKSARQSRTLSMGQEMRAIVGPSTTRIGTWKAAPEALAAADTHLRALRTAPARRDARLPAGRSLLVEP